MNFPSLGLLLFLFTTRTLARIIFHGCNPPTSDQSEVQLHTTLTRVIEMAWKMAYAAVEVIEAEEPIVGYSINKQKPSQLEVLTVGMK